LTRSSTQLNLKVDKTFPPEFSQQDVPPPSEIVKPLCKIKFELKKETGNKEEDFPLF
jgi:hypothetical protein